MFAPIIALFQGLVVKFGLWFLDKILAGMVNGSMDDEVLEKMCEAFDSKVDLAQQKSPEAGKAFRERVEKFADTLKANLIEDDGVN